MVSERSLKTMDAIVETIAHKMGIERKDIFEGSRRRGIIEARRMAMALCRTYTKCTLQQIAYYFGKLDHTTVIHNVARHDEILSCEKAYREIVKEICEALEVSIDKVILLPHGYTLAKNGELYGFFRSKFKARAYATENNMEVVEINPIKWQF
jgi:hypothetical protein